MSSSSGGGGTATSSAERDVVVATHYWSPGWASALDEYLKPRADRYRWIAHPLFADGSVASYRLYEKGREVKSFDAAGVRNPSRFIEDIRRTIGWTRAGGPTDLFIAGDNLIALAGLWLRRRGLARTVVLYTIDYVPSRFPNPLLNRAYHRVDRYAAHHADVVWNTASGIVEARRERDSGRSLAPQLVVPIGAYTKRIAAEARRHHRGRTIAYLGHLIEKQGVQVVIEAMPDVVREFPDARLLVIGDGPYRGRLEAIARNLGVEKNVEFAGFMDDHSAIERRLLECEVGVAPYVPGLDNYSQFQDLAGKIVTYLACGLPAIMTNVPRQVGMIEAAGAGLVVDYSAGSFARAILGYLGDQASLAKARLAALEFARAYDWDEIFERALAETDRLTGGLRQPA